MDSEEDDQLFTTFTHRDAFLALLEEFLAPPPDDTRSDEQEDKLVERMGAIVRLYLALIS